MINEPKGDKYYGGDVSGPAFAKIMSGALQMLNVEPISEQEAVHLATARGAQNNVIK